MFVVRCLIAVGNHGADDQSEEHRGHEPDRRNVQPYPHLMPTPGPTLYYLLQGETK